MIVDSLPRNYTKVPPHFNDEVYIQPSMIAPAKYTQGAATETESGNDTFTGLVWAEKKTCVSKHSAAHFNL